MNIQQFNEFFSDNAYAILGFPKCGTQALKAHLIKKGKTCSNLEIIYRPNGFAVWDLQKFQNRTPIIIFRNPIDRLWSGYHYWSYFYRRMSFKEFLDFKDPNWQSVGFNDPIACCDYEKYINLWKTKLPNLKTVRLEDISHIITKTNDTKKNLIPDKYREMVLNRLSDRGILC